MAALGTILAAIIGVGLWALQARYARREDERRRAEQVRGMLVALLAETDVNLERLERTFGPACLERHLLELRDVISDPIEEASGKDMPVAPADSTNFVFDELKKELRLLPDAVVDAVVRYYQYDLKLTKLMGLFTSGGFTGISDRRQKRALDEYGELGTIALKSALAAKLAIDQHLTETTRAPGYVRQWADADASLFAELNRGDDRT